MLVNASMIFLHHPKTGGTSVQAYLGEILPGPHYPADDASLDDRQKAWMMHQGLEPGLGYARHLGLDPSSVPILVTIRNPYALMLSGYLYLEQKWKRESGPVGESFVAYLEGLLQRTPADVIDRRAALVHGPYSGYLTLRGAPLRNLFVARTESLAEEVQAFLENRLNIVPAMPFPHLNRTEHGKLAQYYSEREEQIVYRMWKNAFESGLYARYSGLDGTAA